MRFFLFVFLFSTSAFAYPLDRIQTLIKLHQEERKLGGKKMVRLEATIRELEIRKKEIEQRVQEHQTGIRKSLKEIHQSMNLAANVEKEKIETPKRWMLSKWVSLSIREVEDYKIDLADANDLEEKIQEEKKQLALLFQDFKEQESVLELNRRLQIEKLMSEFNVRKELGRVVKTDNTGGFEKLKGKLTLPLKGRIISSFGQLYDPSSNLYIFKKGIEIAPVQKKENVRSVSQGKVVFSGELPQYGLVSVIDHGGHYYSLFGHLGEIYKKKGDPVENGETIGVSDNSGTPVYFEIRARNVAVNPLQWFVN